MASGKEQDHDDGGFLSRWSRRKGLVRQGAVVAEPAAITAPAAPLAPAAPAALAPPVAPAGSPVAPAEPGALRPAVLPRPGVSVDAPAVQPDLSPPAAAPPPTLADVAALTPESDYARFVAPGVDRGVKNAALKKLFTNPHFNIMDGLDTYIDDYGKPDPLPAGMLRQMAQSHALGLFADDPAPPPVVPADAAADPALPADRAAVPPIDAIPDLPETLPLPKPIPHEDAALRLQPHDAAGPAGPGPGAGPHAGRQH
ncbi:MAG: DUF3306 domain-containing protein [Microbacteriaceae bacterium]|nr:DUF3306 domain-containing protein [Burkholderiaceae bacterium]